MLRSASNNAVAGSPSSTRRDKAKERREIVSSGERHTYTSLRLPTQSTIPRTLWRCNTPAGQQRDNLCGVENLLRIFFNLSLYNFVEKVSLRNISTLRIDKVKRIYFFFSSGSFWKCFYLCFYCCAREHLESCCESVLKQAEQFEKAWLKLKLQLFFFRCIRSGYIQLVAKLQRELMYLCEAFLLGSVTPEAEDFFRNNVELSAWFTKIRASWVRGERTTPSSTAHGPRALRSIKIKDLCSFLCSKLF